MDAVTRTDERRRIMTDKLDKAIADVAYILDCLIAYRGIVTKGCCNNCNNHNCGIKPNWGDIVRYNCPSYIPEEQRK